MTTLCRDCDYVALSTRSNGPRRWRCMAHPVLVTDPTMRLVDPDYRPDPPYSRCVDVRSNLKGDCPKFQPLRQGAKE